MIGPGGRRPIVAILGPTATGKSALALALARRFDGEIVSCDSTAVYRGFDIGTDKAPREARGRVPHHLIDVVDPTEPYTAARYAREASAAIRAIQGRDRVPIVVGGTGFYFRALTRGLFPGPGRDDCLRARLERVGSRRGTRFLHRMVARVDPASARRIQPNDARRLVRALEVFFLTGKPLTDHFAQTVSPLDGAVVSAFALTLPPDALLDRISRRVDHQFASGLLGEIRALLERGVPPTAPPFGGLVYRQALEHLRGVRDEAATRALIVQENRRYAKRQLIWFRKESKLRWLQGPGERADVIDAVSRALSVREMEAAGDR
jgi:tRNA dimethylallyltransferase